MTKIEVLRAMDYLGHIVEADVTALDAYPPACYTASSFVLLNRRQCHATCHC